MRMNTNAKGRAANAAHDRVADEHAAHDRVADEHAAHDRVAEELWLLGQPPLSDHLDFVARCVVGGEAMGRRALTDAWRAANDHYATLEASETGYVEGGSVRKLPSALGKLAAGLAETTAFKETFDALPVTFGMVELDRLIVYQPHVTLPFVDRLAARLGPKPKPETLFETCFPAERVPPPVAVRRISDKRFQFVSPSTDLRYHEPRVIDRAMLQAGSFGPVAAAIGVVVGFSSNFLSVVRSDKRLLLQNGYHRAVALRRAGITHAPAVIQTVTRRDELALVASETVMDDPAFFFLARRPPLLKDFFDPKIATVLPVRRMEKIVEVRLEVSEIDVPSV